MLSLEPMSSVSENLMYILYTWGRLYFGSLSFWSLLTRALVYDDVNFPIRRFAKYCTVVEKKHVPRILRGYLEQWSP